MSRCQWWFLTEKGGVCRNMLVTDLNKDCPFSDQTMCPAYTPLKVIDQEDADVKIFTNPMGEWHADPMGVTPITKEDVKDLDNFEMAKDIVRTVFLEAAKKKETEKMMHHDDYDVISHPSHYTEGRKYEPKDVIRDWGLNFNLGCVVKYISRAGRKDDILQDLEKARQYLDFEIKAITEEQNGRY